MAHWLEGTGLLMISLARHGVGTFNSPSASAFSAEHISAVATTPPAPGGIHAVATAEIPIMLAYGEALAGTGKPLVAAGSIGSPGSWAGRPPKRTRPFPAATSTEPPCGLAMSWRPP
jgi:hypothetical protein